MAQRMLRVAALGLGDMGRVHAEHLSRIRSVDLTICSRRRDIAEEVAKKLNVSKIETDYDKVFRDPNIDAVVISTACTEHEEHIIKAAQGGKHIWTEKPLAFSRPAVTAILDAVKKSGVKFQVGFMRRFAPEYALAKQKINAGVIGKPVLFKSTSRDPFWPEKQDGPGYNSTFLDLAVHDVDLARWLLSSEVKTVYAIGGALVYKKLKEFGDCDNAIATFTMESGALATVDFSRNARYGYHVTSEVLGDKGCLQIGETKMTSLLTMTPEGISHDDHPWYMDRFRAAFRNEIENFIDNLQTGKAMSPTGEDGRRATCVGLALVESWKTGKPVDVDYSL
eukprot:tig00000802_g4299.t1